MGKKASSAKSAALASKGVKGQGASSSTAIIAGVVLLLAIAGGWILQSRLQESKVAPGAASSASAPVEPEAEGDSSEVLAHAARGEALLDQGKITEGIRELVAAQRLDASSVRPAEVLGAFRSGLGEKAPQHIRSLVKGGIEQLEKALFEELDSQGELEGRDNQLRLAKLKMLYHPSDEPVQGEKDLSAASTILAKLNAEEKEARVGECERVAQNMESIAQHRRELTDELKRGASVKDVAKRLVPKPAFTSVDRRAGLSFKEYMEEYVQKKRPVIITDYAERMFGGGVWGWDEVREACGEMDIYVSERQQEARHMWASLAHGDEKRSLSSFIDGVRAGTAPEHEYLMDWGLAGRCDAFTEKFIVPKYFAGDLWKKLPFDESGAKDFFHRHPSLFVGRSGSGGALHVDSYASTFWQILLKGKKRWTLYALPDALRRTLLYAGVEHEIMPHVPLAGDDRGDALPLIDVADEFKVVVEVNAGELMVVPFDTPHMVENVEDILAISMNVLDHVALPRVVEDLRARTCFSSDDALTANLDLVTNNLPQRDLELEDVPFSVYRSYGKGSES